MSELKLLFEQMATELERGETDVDYAVAHFRAASKIAEQILDACKARGIEPLSLVVDMTSEETRMCTWAALFYELGAKLYKTEAICSMYLAAKLYRGFRDALKPLQELLDELKKQKGYEQLS